MKTNIFLFFLFISFFKFSIAQDYEVNFEKSQINVPEIFDFGDVNDIEYQKVTLINKRSTAVIIKNVETPTGFFVNMPENSIKPKKRMNIYIGIDPSETDKTGEFSEKIIIKTNLIEPVVLNVKGKIIR